LAASSVAIRPKHFEIRIKKYLNFYFILMQYDIETLVISRQSRVTEGPEVKLSKRGEYALRALIDLGIASELGWPMLQISELASKEKLPIKFLEQIFTQLKGAGFVKSRRGKFGGYSLARPMNQIKFGSVIRLIDGPLAPIRCVSQTSYARCSCPDENHCGLRMLMFDVRNAISTILDRYTLADIVEITLRKYRRNKVTPPFLHRSISRTSVLPQTKNSLRSRRRAAARNRFSGSSGSETNNHPPNVR
jgi:Rrf2 family protein